MRNSWTILLQVFQRLLAAVGATAMTVGLFLVLPLIQAITQPANADTLLQPITTTNIPPPPPPEEEQEEEPPEPEEEPPELMDEAPPLDLSQLELALHVGMGEGWMGGDFAVELGTLGASHDDVDALFSMADLDQKPRVVYQPQPILDEKLRKRTPGTVKVVFIVDERGRVEDPIVLSSTDPAFERPALAAVKKWKFEPGMRSGEAVRFRMRIPVTFPKE